MNLSIACFISPHGYGHAARSAAVIEALHRRAPNLLFHIYTRVPQWFFRQSLGDIPFRYHDCQTDIGLKQRSPLHEDIAATTQALRSFIPFRNQSLNQLAVSLRRQNVRLLLADIAPLGVAVARRAGVPVVLIENFTWDWIYKAYLNEAPELQPFIEYLADLYRQADVRIQTEPVCQSQPSAEHTAPVSRTPRRKAAEIRRALQIPDGKKTVLVSMGGVPTRHRFLDKLKRYPHIRFVLPNDVEQVRREDNLVLLPHHSEFYHPDLVQAADAVVGKLGYSTLSEIYHAGIPYGYIPRDRFPESAPLARFVKHRMNGLALDADAFLSGRWIASVEALLDQPIIQRREANGALTAAGIIMHHINRTQAVRSSA